MAAIVKNIIKVSDKECIVKFQGNSGSVTLNLTELVAPNEVISGTPAVNIAGGNCTGDIDGCIQFTRNGVIVMTLNSGASPSPDLSGAMIPPDSINNTYPIVATVVIPTAGGSLGQCEVWLRLRKVDGYVRTIETPVFGAYDDRTQVGS